MNAEKLIWLPSIPWPHTLRIPQAALTLLILCQLGAPPVCADVITIDKAPDSVFATGASFNAIAGGLLPGSFTVDSVDPAMLPFGASLAASHPTGSPTATAMHDVILEPDYSSGPAFFDSTFTSFARSATVEERATAEGHIEFTVDTFASYAIDGFFEVDDFDGGFGQVELEVHLVDITAGAGAPVSLFSSYQKSVMTNDQGFLVGGLDGDDISAVFGSPTGILDPSKRYAFIFLANTLATDMTTDGASAFGRVSLVVTSAVPEPGLAFPIAIGSLLGIARRRRD